MIEKVTPNPRRQWMKELDRTERSSLGLIVKDLNHVLRTLKKVRKWRLTNPPDRQCVLDRIEAGLLESVQAMQCGIWRIQERLIERGVQGVPTPPLPGECPHCRRCAERGW
jgi:hypothetical protein